MLSMLLASTSFLAFSSAAAVLDLDGTPGTLGGSYDWADLNADAGTSPFLSNTGIQSDLGLETIFSTGGSKDENAISRWRHKSGSVPDKNNILNAAAASVTANNGDTLLYFMMDRFANDGDFQTGLWLLGDRVVLDGGKFKGEHLQNDLLIIISFETVTVGTATVYRWIVSGDAPASDPDCSIPGPCLVKEYQSDCAAEPLTACFQSNPDPAASPWDLTTKTGATDVYPEFSFFEGAVNLNNVFTAAGVAELPCIKTMMAESRSSSSLSAQLKDFVRGDFYSCGCTVEPDFPLNSVSAVCLTDGFRPEGETCAVQCVDGYSLAEPGATAFTCSPVSFADGTTSEEQWSGQPTCTPDPCDNDRSNIVSNDANDAGTWSCPGLVAGKIPSGGSCDVQCGTDYEPSGGWSCFAGEWTASDPAPTCTHVCEDDTAAPSMSCKSVEVTLDGNPPEATVTGSDVDDGSSDDCCDGGDYPNTWPAAQHPCAYTLSRSSGTTGTTSKSAAQQSKSETELTFTCADVGDVNVKLTGADETPNSADCSTTVTVNAPACSEPDLPEHWVGTCSADLCNPTCDSLSCAEGWKPTGPLSATCSGDGTSWKFVGQCERCSGGCPMEQAADLIAAKGLLVARCDEDGGADEDGETWPSCTVGDPLTPGPGACFSPNTQNPELGTYYCMDYRHFKTVYDAPLGKRGADTEAKELMYTIHIHPDAPSPISSLASFVLSTCGQDTYIKFLDTSENSNAGSSYRLPTCTAEMTPFEEKFCCLDVKGKQEGKCPSGNNDEPWGKTELFGLRSSTTQQTNEDFVSSKDYKLWFAKDYVPDWINDGTVGMKTGSDEQLYGLIKMPGTCERSPIQNDEPAEQGSTTNGLAAADVSAETGDKSGVDIVPVVIAVVLVVLIAAVIAAVVAKCLISKRSRALPKDADFYVNDDPEFVSGTMHGGVPNYFSPDLAAVTPSST